MLPIWASNVTVKMTPIPGMVNRSWASSDFLHHAQRILKLRQFRIHMIDGPCQRAEVESEFRLLFELPV